MIFVPLIRMAAVSLHLRRLRLRAGKGRVDAESILRAEFEREALGAERLRVLVLTIVITVSLFLSLIPPTFFSEGIEHVFRGEMQAFVFWRFVILLVLALYLVAERILLGYVFKNGRKVPGFYRYATAFVETSFPTAEIILLASYTDDQVAALAIPVFIYPVFIVLSALRLNFRLCVFTGAVAALEYTLVGMFYLDRADGSALNPLLVNGPLHVRERRDPARARRRHRPRRLADKETHSRFLQARGGAERHRQHVRAARLARGRGQAPRTRRRTCAARSATCA